MGAKSWAVKNIIRGKTILFIIITIILTKVFYELANIGLNAFLNSFNDHPLYTPNYSFGKYGLLLIIPAALIAIIILKLYTKIRNVPYQNESDLSPEGLRKLKDNIITVATHRLTKLTLIIIGSYILLEMLIVYVRVFIYIFPDIKIFILRKTIMPAMYLTGAAYLYSVSFMGVKAFSKKPMNLSSKYGAIFGFLALATIVFAVGALFAIPGIILSIIGIIKGQNEGRKTAVYGLLSSLASILIIGGIITIGYLYSMGKI